jgi:hypothetical protein
LEGFRRWQALGVGGVQINHDSDLRLRHELAAADSKTPDLNQAGQFLDGMD